LVVLQIKKTDNILISSSIDIKNKRSIAQGDLLTKFEKKLINKINKINNDTEIARLALLIEQISIPSSKIDYYLPTVVGAQRLLMKQLENRLLKYDLDISDYVGDMAWNVNFRNKFIVKLSTFKNKNDQAGYCQLLYLLHALAVSRTTLRDPAEGVDASKLYSPDSVRQIPSYQSDLDYVRWQYRYFSYTNILDSGYIRSCQDLVFSSRRFADEVKLRLDFLENGILIESKKSNQVINQIRYPLGRAINMCGRPNFAHYSDYAGASDESRGFPKSIGCIAGYPEIKELENCILNL